MIEKGKGGANTLSGLRFEKGRDVISRVENLPGYSVKDNIIYFQGKEVAKSYKKHALYVYLRSEGINYKQYISKRLLPDEAIHVISSNTLFVIEMKFQNSPAQWMRSYKPVISRGNSTRS